MHSSLPAAMWWHFSGRLFALSVAFGCVLAVTCPASAQCAEEWALGEGVPGLNGSVQAMVVWDRDGDGPQTPVLVVAGVFSLAGNTPVSNVASWDGVEWRPVGSGTNGPVYDLITLPNGDLIAGGEFTAAGGVPANNVARWNGGEWSGLGAGVGSGGVGRVYALAALSNGDLVVAGVFTTAGSVSAKCIARWNGTEWSALGSGVSFGTRTATVYALATLPNGELIAGGRFTSAGGVAANNVARWDGTQWWALGAGVTRDETLQGVRALAALPNGDVIVGGIFSSASGFPVRSLARWDGVVWSSLEFNAPWSAFVFELKALPNGDLIVGGDFDMLGGAPGNGIARLSGTTWSAIGSGASGAVGALATLPNGDLVASGAFAMADGSVASGLARWDGSAWSALATGTTGDFVRAVATLSNGDVVAAGFLKHIGGTAVKNIARWDGTGWSALGSGIDREVLTMLPLANGGLVVAGNFGDAGGVAVNNIARWDGMAWSALGQGLYGVVRALAEAPNGDVIAGGWFSDASGDFVCHVARWDGTVWMPLGARIGPEDDFVVYSLVALANGRVIAGAGWTSDIGLNAHGLVALWDGASWASLGSGIKGPANVLRALPNGDLVAGGLWTDGDYAGHGYIARWNGTAWIEFGPAVHGRVEALVVLPNGDLIADGWFSGAGSGSFDQLGRWNGTSWSALPSDANGDIVALATRPNGDLVAGGWFTTIDGRASAYVARYTGIARCPADFNCSGGAEVEDLFEYLDAWFTNDARADVNRDGLSIDDLFLFVQAWFEGC